ncbi:hypothetical protein CU098_004055, partial [Rhizopus stolonifer]
LSSLSYTGTSDSEDDFSSNFGNDNDALDNYNVSDKLKNLLRLGSFRMEDDLARLDDESEDDSQTAAIREIEKRIPKETSENKLRQEDSDNEEEHTRKSKKTKGKSGRKTRKERTVSTMVDENGERLVRTMEFLNSSEESSDEDRPMSKKEMLNMYRERERTLRSSELKIKPAMNVKSYDTLEESSDSDLEIVYDSKLYITSPERGRQPPSLTSSPIRNGDANHRVFNQSLVKRIYEQTHEHRKSMEEAAKARVDSDDIVDSRIKEMDTINNKTEDDLNEENTQKKPRRRILSDSEESDVEDKPSRRVMSDSDEDENTNKKLHTEASNRMDIDILDKIRIKQKEKNDYVVEEASEEEDEYFGMGGPDIDETEDLDRYEHDGLLVENNEETDNVDKAALRTMFYEQDAESDRNMVERLLKDITSGGLRKRKAALEEGFMFDDIDIYDDDDDLIAVRKAAAAKRRRMLQEHGGALEALAKDPKTEAFVRAARATRDGAIVMLDDSEEEIEKEKDEDEENEGFGKSLNAYLISDDEDEDVDEDEEMEEKNIIPEADSEKDKHSDQTNKTQEKITHLSDDDDDDEDIPLFSLA